MKVKIQYFKDNGKYYSNGKIEIEETQFYEACKSLITMFNNGIRPGLVDGFEFHAYCKVYTKFGPLPFLYIRQKSR